MTSIVTVNVTQTVAPTPSLLQQTGALISQGGTNLAAGTYSFLTQLADLTPLLSSPLAISSLTWSNNVVTAELPATTIALASYNATTGVVTITLTEALSGMSVGSMVVISGATGTGAYADLDGTWPVGSGSSGTTLYVTLPPSLTMTITGGNVALSHGVTTAETFITTIAGATPAGYNGTYVATAASATSFTYALASNPGTETVPGTYTPRNVGELTAMATTFFAQGALQGVYVLELGAGEAAAGVTELSAFITANPNFFYSYLVPRNWDGVAGFLALIESFESPTAKTYFFVTTTTGTYSAYTNLMKCVYAFVEAPSIPVTEFSAAAAFQVRLRQQPSATNKVTPYAFSYLYGVTPYPTKGNSALFSALKVANINYVGTSAEGGITNTILLWGVSLDGRDGLYWYSVDWAQINSDENLANTIINGSNNPINPLYYDQNGINRLQDTVVATMNSAVTFGLATGSVVRTSLTGPALDAALDAGTYSDQIIVNAVPFIPYLQANPGDYKIGQYSGLSVVYIPSRGFISILFNLNVTDFAATA